jgi:hypothetical protein
LREGRQTGGEGSRTNHTTQGREKIVAINSNQNEAITQSELFKEAFYYANSFKRHRALATIAKQKGERDTQNYHNLKQYEFFDQLELALRALQKGHRDLQAEMQEESE